MEYSMRSTGRGFTLIEMMVVITIVLLLMAMSVPFFGNFSTSQALNTSTREISTMLSTARSYAITRNVNYSAVFDTTTDPNRFWIALASSPTIPLDKGYQLPMGVRFNPGATITFTTNGGLLSTSVNSVMLRSSNGKGKLFTVDVITGAVDIQLI